MKRVSKILAPLGKPIATATVTYPPKGTFRQVVTPLPPLRLFGTGLRIPTAALTRSGNNYVAGDFAVGMPGHDVEEVWFFFPTFYCSNSAEVDCPNGYTVEAMATRASGGQRTPGQIDDGTSAIVIDPSVTATQYGKWIKFTPAAPIPAGTRQTFSVAQYIPDGAYPRSRGGTAATASIYGGTTADERSQGSTSSLVSTLSGTSDYSNANGGIVMPAAAMCRTPEGIESVLIIGTSIDYGADATSAAFFTERMAFGYMEVGLDDNTTSRRVQALNWALPGWGHASTGTTNSQSNVTACARQLWAMEKARELNNDLPLVTAIFSGHGTNTSGTQTQLRADYRLLASVWRDAVGVASGAGKTPFYQAEMLPRPASTDGFATLVNQTPAAQNAYPSGERWLLNADIGGADGLGDAAANLRADDTIQGSFAPWRVSGADLADDRDKLAVRAFTTTLASSYGGSGDISLTDAPAVGDYLSLVEGGNTSGFIVRSVSGSGPYAVTPSFTTGSGLSYTTAAAVQSMWHDTTGLHPGPLAHKAYAEDSVMPFKVSIGWTAPLAAPAFSASSISGTAEDGQVLTANATVTGNPTPTLAYQWQKNGTNISGQTSATITLDETGMSLADGDTISCEITATNSQGSVSAEPTIAYVVPAPPASLYDTSDLAYISGPANGDEIIDTDSFRLARGAADAVLVFGITDAGVNGAKRIRFTPSAYDGSESGITLIRIEVRDGAATTIQDVQNTTARDFTHTFVNGSIRFLATTNGRGGRIDGLIIEDAT